MPQSQPRFDQQNVQLVTQGGASTVSNITVATVIKATAGRICKVSVIVAGSAVGTVNNCATTGAAAVANQVGTTPTALGTTDFQMVCSTGIVVVPGTGQTLAVSYN